MSQTSTPHVFDAPNADAFHNGPVIHHFEDFGLRGYRGDARYMRHNPIDTLKTMPLDWVYFATEGGGANGTPGYVALEAYDAQEFYAESTPIWWIPGRTFDLRNTWTTFYLKALQPITVAPGYEPYLFIAAYIPASRSPKVHLSCWYLTEPLKVGQDEWAYNELLLTTDQSKWINYTRNPASDGGIEIPLGQCGYIGWMYLNDHEFRNVRATGVMGWDEFAFNLHDDDLAEWKAGRIPEHSLVL
jgi:hypothetical protein